MKRLIFAAMVAAGPVSGQGDECAAIEDDAERLACFDSAYQSSTEGDVEKSANQHRWLMNIERSEMTDQTNVYISVVSEHRVQCRGSYEPAYLTLRCFENVTAAILEADCHMTSHSYGADVTYRVDESKAKTRTFIESTDNSALGLWTFRTSKPFVDDLLAGNTVLVRFTPFNEGTKEVRFDLTGITDAIRPLRSACGW